MERRILKIQMLGCFSLEYDGKELVLDRNKVSKTTQLFQLILLHSQDRGISKVALIEALYGRSDISASKAARRGGASGKQLYPYKWRNVYLGS